MDCYASSISPSDPLVRYKQLPFHADWYLQPLIVPTVTDHFDFERDSKA